MSGSAVPCPARRSDAAGHADATASLQRRQFIAQVRSDRGAWRRTRVRLKAGAS